MPRLIVLPESERLNVMHKLPAPKSRYTVESDTHPRVLPARATPPAASSPSPGAFERIEK